MVHGLKKFKAYFEAYPNQYVFIGGTSCDILSDAFKLLANVSITNRIETAEEIQDDVIQFIDKIKEDKPDLMNLGIRGTSLDEMLMILSGIFLKKTESIDTEDGYI